MRVDDAATHADLLEEASTLPAQLSPPSSAPAHTKEPEFDFWDPRNGLIAVEHQPRICVYTNRHNAIVIRQEGGFDDDEDSFVYVRPANVKALVDALIAERDGRR